MRLRLSFSALIAAFVLSAAMFAAGPTKDEDVYIVGIEPGATLPHRIVWQDEEAGIALVRVPKDIRATMKPLAEFAGVRYAFADVVLPLNALPPAVATEPSPAPRPTGFDGFRGQVAREELAPVHVIVMDSGVNREHPALRGKIAEGLSLAFTDDPDPLTDAPANPAIYGHGTYVALGVTDMAPNAMVVSYRIFEPIVGERGGLYLGTKFSRIIQAFSAARILSARNPEMRLVVNCSFMYGNVPELTQALEEIIGAMRQRVSIVPAAGNERGSTFQVNPCSIPETNMTCVTSSTADNALSSFANYGSEVAIAAIGEYVRFTSPQGVPFLYFGTSFSAPKVAGTYAVLLGLPSATVPTPEQLRTAVVSGGTTVPALQYKAGSKVLNPAGAAAVYRRIAAGELLPPLAWWRFASALDTFEGERDEVRRFSPGDVVVVSGHGFCSEPQFAPGWPNPTLPLPTELCGTRVVLNNGYPIGILWATPGAVAFQLPPDDRILWSENHVSIEKVEEGAPTAALDLPFFRVAAKPCFFVNDDGTGTAYTEINGPSGATTAKFYVSGLGWWSRPIPGSDLVIPLTPLSVEVNGMPVSATVRTTQFLGVMALEIPLPSDVNGMARMRVSVAEYGSSATTEVSFRVANSQ